MSPHLASPGSAASPGAALPDGRELTAAEVDALSIARRRAGVTFAGVIVAGVAFVAVILAPSFHAEPAAIAPPPLPAPPPPPPPAPELPEYAPTGVDAELKRQGAAGITYENAATKAVELEAVIDAGTGYLEAERVIRGTVR